MKKTLFVVFLAVMALMLVSGTSFADVAGTCSTCHTMHDSQGNADVGAAGQFESLTLGGCVYCHGDGAMGDVWNNAGDAGAFSNGATAANLVHNVREFAAGWGLEDEVTLAAVTPGDPTAAARAQGSDELTCSGATGCHTVAHHTNAGGMLGTFTTGSGGAAATTISKFCADCHTDFHTAAGPWMRHPTDVQVPSNASYDNANANATYGSDGATSDFVMCTSCHKAHGTAEPDLLRFAMSTADSNDTTGCLACHISPR